MNQEAYITTMQEPDGERAVKIEERSAPDCPDRVSRLIGDVRAC